MVKNEYFPTFLSTFLEEKNLKTVYVIDPVYSIDWRWYSYVDNNIPKNGTAHQNCASAHIL